MSDGVQLVRLQSTASYLFAADNARASTPFDPEIGTALAKEFAATEFFVQPADRPSWVARQGVCAFSESRRIVVNTLIGSAHELAATVEGTTGDARDVLDELWSKLGELGGSAPSSMTEAPGAFTHHTMAIVIIPAGLDAVFPGLRILQDIAREKLGGALVQKPDTTVFKVEVPVDLTIRGLTIRRSIVIEPRFTAVDKDCTYFTVSPLPSDDHLGMLERLCGLS